MIIIGIALGLLASIFVILFVCDEMMEGIN
jgi:hypothetical protein